MKRTLSNLPELRLCVRASVPVRVILHGQFVEGLFDLALGRISGNAQDFIVIFLGQDYLGDHQDAHG